MVAVGGVAHERGDLLELGVAGSVPAAAATRSFSSASGGSAANRSSSGSAATARPPVGERHRDEAARERVPHPAEPGDEDFAARRSGSPRLLSSARSNAS